MPYHAILKKVWRQVFSVISPNRSKSTSLWIRWTWHLNLQKPKRISSNLPKGTDTMITESEILTANILIVDDQETNVSLLEQLLCETGYTCVSSTMNPEEVCALHLKNGYD